VTKSASETDFGGKWFIVLYLQLAATASLSFGVATGEKRALE